MPVLPEVELVNLCVKKARAVISVLLLAWVLGGCEQSAPVVPSSEYSEHLEEAQRLNDEGSYALAELQARNALRLKAGDPQAKLALFKSLKEQSDPALQEEAKGLAQELSTQLPTNSADAILTETYLNQLQSEAALSDLARAFEEESPDVLKLLEDVPDDVRGARYWEIAYKVHEKNEDLKMQLESAKKWISFNPKGRDARSASKLVEAEALGLLRGPEKAFESMREKPVEKRKPYILHEGKRTEWFGEFLEASEVVEVKAKGEGLEVELRVPNKITGQVKSAKLYLAYQMSANGSAILDLANSDLREGFTYFAHPRYTIREDFYGINEIKGREDYQLLGPLTRAFGPGEYLERVLQLDEEGRKATGKTTIQRGAVVLFDDSHISVSVFQAKEDGKLFSRYLDILSPKYRFRSGLGVGNTVEEFSSTYTLKQTDSGRNDYHMKLMVDGKRTPLTRNGAMDAKAEYFIDSTIPTDRYSKHHPRLELYVDEQDVVLGIRIRFRSFVSDDISY